ncbi:hypothetical protein MCRY_07115 [Marivita cryptomonadis]|nr:hypothetical protein MCRY_07115 [Marivita cryptomonadis]
MAVGSSLRGERFDTFSDRRAQLSQHVADHMIWLDQQARCFDLTGGVSVADMPSKADEVLPCDFQEWFRGRDHFDLAPIVEFDRTAMVKRSGLFKVEQELESAIGCEDTPPQEAGLVAERDTVSGRAVGMVVVV